MDFRPPYVLHGKEPMVSTRLLILIISRIRYHETNIWPRTQRTRLILRQIFFTDLHRPGGVENVYDSQDKITSHPIYTYACTYQHALDRQLLWVLYR